MVAYFGGNAYNEMKRFTASELILLMLAGSVCVVLVLSVAGIVFKGSAVPNEGSIAIRSALIDLLKVIVGGVIGSAVTSSKKDL